MTTLLQIGVSNLAMAGALAVLAATVGRWSRRPALAHALWVLVLVKLITPPLAAASLPWPDAPAESSVARSGPEQAQPPAPAAVARKPEMPSDAPAVADQHEIRAAAERGEGTPAQPPPASTPPMSPLMPATRELPERVGFGMAGTTPADPLPAVVADEGAGIDWPWLAAMVWLAGSVLWALLAGRRVWQFERLLRHGQMAPERLRAETENIAGRLGVACPEVWLVPGAVSPMIWVLGRARRLLVPQSLLPRLSDEQRQALLTHELAHLRRGDHWVRLLELIVRGLYWWCPLVWWAQRELREAEEECCDAWVLWAWPGCARAYAHALVDTVDFLSEARPVLHPVGSGFGPVHSLRRRVTMILRGKTPRALTWAGVLGVLALAALALPLVPGWAQQPPTQQPEERQKERDLKEAQRDELRVRLEKQKQAIQKEAEELKRLSAELERRSAQLQHAMQQLQKVENDLAQGKRPEAEPPTGKQGAGDLDRRLRDLENKLDRVLKEVLELRRELKGRGGPGGAPGADPRNRTPRSEAAPETPTRNPFTPTPKTAPSRR